MPDSGAEIRDLARSHEYDRYLSALLGPRKPREALIVLAAFAAEVSRIPHMVSEPMMAAVRLQWWRDRLQEIGRNKIVPVEPPLLHLLATVVVSHRLPVGLLSGMIDACDCEVDVEPLSSRDDVRGFLVKFEAAQFMLAARIAACEKAGQARDLLTDAGLAYGYSRLIEQYAWRSKGAQTFLPRDVMKADSAGTGRLAREFFAGEAEAAFERCRAAQWQLPPVIRPLMQNVLRPLAVVEPILAIARQRGIASGGGFPLSPFSRAKSLLWTRLSGRL